DTDKVIAALEKTDYVGVRGRVQFDATHDVKDGPGFVNLLFVQWQNNGERVVVWPKELTTGKMINPPWLASNSRAACPEKRRVGKGARAFARPRGQNRRRAFGRAVRMRTRFCPRYGAARQGVTAIERGGGSCFRS